MWDETLLPNIYASVAVHLQSPVVVLSSSVSVLYLFFLLSSFFLFIPTISFKGLSFILALLVKILTKEAAKVG